MLWKLILALKTAASCTHLILTNRKYSFENTTWYETRLSDYHHIVLLFNRKNPSVSFIEIIKTLVENFKSDLQEALQGCNGSYDAFDNYCTSSLNKHTLKKKKILWRNGKLHMNKNSRWVIMKRPQLKTKANKTKNSLDIIIIKNSVTM